MSKITKRWGQGALLIMGLMAMCFYRMASAQRQRAFAPGLPGGGCCSSSFSATTAFAKGARQKNLKDQRFGLKSKRAVKFSA